MLIRPFHGFIWLCAAWAGLLGLLATAAGEEFAEAQASAVGNYPQQPDTYLWEGPATAEPEGGVAYQWGALGRAFYSNDQRIEFTGQEATFGAEGILTGTLSRDYAGWTTGLTGELFVNQPFDRNILVDYSVRRSFRGNFEIDPLEISQLFVSARRGDVMFALGKMVTPFGRTYFPLYTNDRSDAPFIRTESILWRETGLLMAYEPGPFEFTAALVNGGLDRDTNSSKAGITRAGIKGEFFAAGASIKWQDGIGSEHQKQYNRHIGLDAMLRHGPWVLSAEAIYDEYGFRKPFDPLDITWRRSIYNRDLNQASGNPLSGLGYYVDLGYQGERWTAMLNYGEFHPRAIGDPIHDQVNRRGIFKLIHHWTPQLDAYGMVMMENGIPVNQVGRASEGVHLLAGLQFAL